jgi:putative membrane protein
MKRVGPLLAILGALIPSWAFAHPIPGPPDAPPGWNFSPWVTAPMAIASALWTVGFIRLTLRSEQGRGQHWREACFFIIGLALLCAAMLSPLHEAGERSFTLHMLEHEIIMLAAAPLFVLARPLPVMLWAFPHQGRALLAVLVRRSAPFWRAVTRLVFATVFQILVLWLWHAPALFDIALSSGFWHSVQHLCFFLAALAFWTAVLDRRRHAIAAALCLFATFMAGGALGALMAVSQSPWYPAYAALGMTPYGLTPAEDQQLAGVLMWVPAGFVHAGAALALLAPLLRLSNQETLHARAP